MISFFYENDLRNFLVDFRDSDSISSLDIKNSTYSLIDYKSKFIQEESKDVLFNNDGFVKVVHCVNGLAKKENYLHLKELFNSTTKFFQKSDSGIKNVKAVLVCSEFDSELHKLLSTLHLNYSIYIFNIKEITGSASLVLDKLTVDCNYSVIESPIDFISEEKDVF